MATKLKDLKTELKYIDHLWRWEFLPFPLKFIPRFVVRIIANYGLVQASTLFEIVVSHLRKVMHVSKDGQDFADGSDAKYATARKHGKRKKPEHHARIKCHNNDGWIIAIVLNECTNVFYYFSFPPYSHKDIKQIEIPFSADGVPLRGRDWWSYSYPTLQQCASIKIPNKEIALDAILFDEVI